jgi:hypothetical protein
MAHVIEKKENYIYIKMTTPHFEFADDVNFVRSIRKIQSENPNIIVNCKSIKTISDEDAFRIKKLYNANMQLAGHIIVSELDELLENKLETVGLNCIPTDEEAIDYIFMEQLEQEFLKDFDQED